MKHLAHDAVAQRAYEIWRSHGCPEGRDLEIWFQAQKELAAETPTSRANDDSWSRESERTLEHCRKEADVSRAKAETAAESVVEYHISPALSEDEAIKAALQKKEGRGPSAIVPEKAPPPKSGRKAR